MSGGSLCQYKHFRLSVYWQKNDSVGVVFSKTKTNQEGSGPRDPRHLYANPLSPSTCWITVLQSIFRVILGWNPEHIFQDPTRNYVLARF
ncbi:hypothetical protein F442_02862 [Phytophthora nicotianae P10297]|uniref:Uncharacterized protein n=2 Tax=Phytophthora nicotianae TaxID=4792 RepID=W3A0M2_PHYNI|nr:hypothetical protein F444_02926 [Phytophthora nicotianae P1976]ETP52079.1 hypothetical protein F442_02862 [Phytophthora nicotianae P10297]